MDGSIQVNIYACECTRHVRMSEIKGAQSRHLDLFSVEHRKNYRYIEGNLKITLYKERKPSKRF